jgi:hypothetical protein
MHEEYEYGMSETLALTDVAGLCGFAAFLAVAVLLPAYLLLIGAPITVPVALGVLSYAVQTACFSAGVCAMIQFVSYRFLFPVFEKMTGLKSA